MPLTKIQTDVLRLIASHRDPESYVAGGTPLNVDGLRYSNDIDVFHDRGERVEAAARSDANTLIDAGFQVSWIRQEPLIYTAGISREGAGTRIEWVVDSDYRFFPAMPDETFGYVLHPLDLAMNKIMASVGRREVRDIVDLVTIHETILPLGPIIWAAVDKAPGFTPEGLIAEIRRTMLYPKVDWDVLTASQPIDPAEITRRLRAALEEAEAFVVRMPTEKMGLLFLKDGKVVQPDPGHLADYQTHAGARRGQWPSSPEIETAMLEHYQKSPMPPDGAEK
jgi:hypothetical protein